ncbi:hypothetical protein [Bdellovibrio sp. HCB2-146]|uniref:hypothetical protein n=1 Tax=Bdellovibrio sp. HCB2-146 TaxID=3394362 RepID=UPI0039BD044E
MLPMPRAQQEHISEEREFLYKVGFTLNKAMFIIDRLMEELREEQGKLENDPEVERLFSNLSTHLSEVDTLVKSRHHNLSEVLDEEHRREKKTKGSSSRNSPQRSP